MTSALARMVNPTTATRLGLAILIAVLWGHGAILMRATSPALEVGGNGHAPLWDRLIAGIGILGIRSDLSSILVGGISGALVLAFMTALAAGLDGTRPAVLLGPLLTALSPTFASASMGGKDEMLIAMLLVAGCARAFGETHRPGSWPWSAVLFGACAGFGPGGLLALAAVFAQKMVFARRFRLGAAVYRFAFIWLAVGLTTFGLLVWLSGGWGIGQTGSVIGIGPLIARLWAEVNGLSVLPFVLLLVVGWKPKALFFLLTMIGFLLAAWLFAGARAPSNALLRVLAPAIPLVMVVVAEALRGSASRLGTAGLGGRTRIAVVATVVASLALGQAWPTLSFLVSR